ncbi:MAG: peptidoglycan DD-metalloendopeptidase family protein [Cyanobacteria bacterium SID2]|nr:peptidoglycan DD-metalloendopeptidase family protein [Cyanobacteria bacterium SID2]
MHKRSTHSKPHRLPLVRSMSWIGSLSVLTSSGVAFAKAPLKTQIYVPEPAAPETVDYQGVAADDVFVAPPEDSFAPLEPLNPPQLDRPVLPPEPQHSYIDTTDYSLGATTPNDAPVVVFEERSSGCEAAIANGQVPASICPPAPQPEVQWTPGIAQQSAPPMPMAEVQPMEFAPMAVNAPGVEPNQLPSVEFSYAQMEAQLLRDMAVRPLTGQFGNGNTRLIFPLSIPAPISSFFGWRYHPIAGERHFHTGTDIAAPMGTPVLAAFTGRVAVAEMLGGYGLAVILEHNDGTAETLYAHLSELLVQPGEQVEQGQVIGRVGSTGYSTGPHLHFEVKQLAEDRWVYLDPGRQLELALTELIDRFQVAQAQPAATDMDTRP